MTLWLNLFKGPVKLTHCHFVFAYMFYRNNMLATFCIFNSAQNVPRV